MPRFTLRLTLDVTYEGPLHERDELEDNLLAIASTAMREGQYTGDLESIVVIADPSVSSLP